MIAQVNVNFIIEGFNDFVRSSSILSVLFQTVSVLVVFFYAITVVRLYSKQMLGSSISLQEILRPLGVVLLIYFWPWIYFKVLVGGFDALISYFVALVNDENDNELKQTVISLALAENISIFDLSVEVLLSFLLKLICLFINTVFDVVVALYVGINDMILGILAPIVLAFTMLEETKDMFVKWLKYFMFYRIFYFMTVAVDYLSNSLLSAVTANVIKGLNMENDPGDMEADSWLAAGLIGLLAYIVFKIVFISASFAILKELFGILGGGVGSSVGDMSKAIPATSRIATAFKK
jgi:hypothetical protein